LHSGVCVTKVGQAFARSLTSVREPIPERFADFLRWVGLEPSEAIEAIADASEGRPVYSALCPKLFGCSNDNLPRCARRVVCVRAGGRGGKTSRLLAPKALHAALTVPLPTLAVGEHAVSLLVAPRELESCGSGTRSASRSDAATARPSTSGSALRPEVASPRAPRR
jgi:hypothetical protein